jgi:hypothetical protein
MSTFLALRTFKKHRIKAIATIHTFWGFRDIYKPFLKVALSSFDKVVVSNIDTLSIKKMYDDFGIRRTTILSMAPAYQARNATPYRLGE